MQGNSEFEENRLTGAKSFGKGIEGWKGWADGAGGLYHVQRSTKGVWGAHVCS